MNEGVKSNLSDEESLTAEDLCSKGVEYCESEEYGKAVECFSKAAEQGNAQALSNLGICYDRGFGVKQDYVEAIKYFSMAEELGSAKSM